MVEIDFDPNKCKAEMNTKIHKKFEKKTVMWGVGLFLTVVFFTTLAVIAAYDRGVKERSINVNYKIYAEAKKVEEKLETYCPKAIFHQADVRLQVLESNVGNIKEDVGELKDTVQELNKRNEKVLRAIERMEHRSMDSGDD